MGRVGPAFSLDEIPVSHAILDRASIPRRLRGETLTLPERISYLISLLEEARSRPVKQIVVISKGEYDAMTKRYQENEVTP